MSEWKIFIDEIESMRLTMPGYTPNPKTLTEAQKDFAIMVLNNIIYKAKLLIFRLEEPNE